MQQQLVAKPFKKENKLAILKKDVSKLEKKISIKIQEGQMKQHNVVEGNTVEVTETPVVKIEKSLLPKKERIKRFKGIRV